MPTYAIGDIQGCAAEFEALLDRIGFDPARDRLWLVGDLVNRGPRSLDVLRRVRALGAAAITVLGNHDLHLLAAALTPSEQLHHDPELNYTMIHAGLPPQWDLALAQACAEELESALRDDDRCMALFGHMYGDHPNRWSDGLQGFDRLRFITNCLTRLRFCRADGRLELKFKGAIGEAPDYVTPWFRAPNRRSRDLRIVCGHWSALGYYEGDGVLSIDTGCVWGQKLCAVRLDQRADPIFVPCSSSGLSAASQ
jgi:bis(5'-nucleosyl)-tetraphosphatase (symmetrical)